MDDAINVFGEPLEPCCNDPLTGFYRDGHCNTSQLDTGSHTVCVKVTESFLSFSRSRGNDLSTPHPEFDFPGLQEGDKWCLCAARWLQAEQQDAAPRVYLKATHIKALDIIPMDILRRYAADLA